MLGASTASPPGIAGRRATLCRAPIPGFAAPTTCTLVVLWADVCLEALNAVSHSTGARKRTPMVGVGLRTLAELPTACVAFLAWARIPGG